MFDQVVALILEEQKCKLRHSKTNTSAKPSKVDSYYLSVHDEAQHDDAELKSHSTPSQYQQTVVLGINLDMIPKKITALICRE